MKINSHLLLTVALLATTSCSFAKTANENANIAWQNSSEMAATNTPTPAPSVENQTAKIAPDALVKDLYKQHDAEKSPFFQKENHRLVDKYFAKSLADTIWKEANEDRDGVGALEADPLYFAQDTDIKNFVVNQPKITGDKAEVIVTFENFKKKEKFNYLLVKENGEWRISDINYGDFTLNQIYSDYNKSETKAEIGSGKFEGKFQIGDAICTVKPTKMVFEANCANSTERKIFLYKGTTGDTQFFEADAGDGGIESLTFDNENYDTGTFRNVKGKEFPVKRIK